MSQKRGIDQALVDRLRQARDDVRMHRRAWEQSRERGFTQELNNQWSESRERLLDRLGVLKRDVHRLAGVRLVGAGQGHVDLFDAALSPHPMDSMPAGQTIRMNILEQLEMAIREALSLAEAGETVDLEPQPHVLRIFISHGGKTSARDRLEKFVRALGAEPVIVEDEPNLGATPNSKVQREIERCHYGVVLVTIDRAAVQDEAPMPRGNIVDERARLAAQLGEDRVLILLEAGVQLPSNILEFVRARFTQDSLDDALTQLAKELRALGFLRVEAKQQ